MPDVDVLLTEDAPSPLNPLGIKGAGEGGITAVGAAIASAIDDAIGVPGAVTRLPATPQRVRDLLRVQGAPAALRLDRHPRLFDDVLRRRVEFGDETRDVLAADRVDFELELVGLGEEGRVLERRHESTAQRRRAVGGHSQGGAANGRPMIWRPD